jgi:cyclophilin family peptidyl-prolyl cis-trans isomerase
MHVIEVETNAGTFTIELYRLHAPKTCYNFLELVKIGQLLTPTLLD